VAASGATEEGDDASSSIGSIQPSARFGPRGPDTVIQHVSLTTDEINIHQPSLGALERLAGHSPEVATRLIEGSHFLAKQNTKRFLGGAIVTGVVCCFLLSCSAYVIVNAGFWAGIAFFMAVVAVSAMMVALLTGKVQDFSWVVRLVPGSRPPDKDAPASTERRAEP